MLWGIFLSIALFSGCAGKVGVRPVELDKRFEDMNRSALNSDSLSEQTQMFLRQRDLVETWKKEPDKVLEQGEQLLKEKPEPDTLFSMMELCFLRAKNAAPLSMDAFKLYLSSAFYAYTYLFDDEIGLMPSAYHPNSRLACDFYNRSLAGCLIIYRDKGMRYGEDFRVPMLRGEVAVTLGRQETDWDPREIRQFHVAYEFEPQGLENHVKSYGIGVPIIAIRVPQPAEQLDETDRFLPKLRQTYAVTALLRFVGTKKEGGKPLVRAEFDLYDPMDSHMVEIGDRDAPLETDFTTPLAYMIERSSVPSGMTGLLRAESWEDRKGLHMLQHYDPNKIPVVFVHGLMSSPETWLSMFNNLLADTRIRQNYQFWFFMYPTGNPISYSASTLRDSLEEARQIFDPGNDNPAFNRMVLVGHSMGGLLSKLMIIESGEDLWNETIGVPFEEIDLTEEQRAFVKRVFFFKPLPFVSRVIFIAVPHKGSYWADRRIGRLGAYMVRLPVTLIKKSFGIFTALAKNEDLNTRFKLENIPTGIDGLRPESPFVILTNEAALPAIPYHSIIGNQDEADTPGGSDGVVPYESSHLNGALSEKIVRSGHSAHRHPLAILEVKRILRQHLEEMGRQEMISQQ
jgi:pimeloyl-ACP methyl ester carboxylesterase